MARKTPWFNPAAFAAAFRTNTSGPYLGPDAVIPMGWSPEIEEKFTAIPAKEG